MCLIARHANLGLCRDSLLGLARALSVTVIATQIQTPAHLAAARSAGIAWVQGDLLAEKKPVAQAPMPSA